jgi:hypothetical protein
MIVHQALKPVNTYDNMDEHAEGVHVALSAVLKVCAQRCCRLPSVALVGFSHNYTSVLQAEPPKFITVEHISNGICTLSRRSYLTLTPPSQ